MPCWRRGLRHRRRCGAARADRRFTTRISISPGWRMRIWRRPPAMTARGCVELVLRRRLPTRHRQDLPRRPRVGCRSWRYICCSGACGGLAVRQCSGLLGWRRKARLTGAAQALRGYSADRFPEGLRCSGQCVIDLLHVVVLLELVDEFERFACLFLRQFGGRRADVFLFGREGVRPRSSRAFCRLPNSGNRQRITSCGSPFSPVDSPISSRP